MLEAVSHNTLLSVPRYGGHWLDSGRNWNRPDLVGLAALCKFSAPIEQSADALGRAPSMLAHRARDMGLKLPPEWRDAITTRKSGGAKLLSYPYIIEARGEHADLIEVNSLVSQGLPEHMRADVCQEIMLALWEKRFTLSEFKSSPKLVNQFIRSARKLNYEAGGYALSLDAPMRDGRSWYDVLPSGDYDGRSLDSL